jgi:hypothetical protein
VWEFVSGLLKDPERIRAGMGRLIDQARTCSHADPEREAKAWVDKLAEADSQRAKAQDLAIEGLLRPDELRMKLAELAETRETAQRELEALRDRRHRVEELEADRDALLEAMATMAPEALDSLTGEERNKVYRMLRLEVSPTPEGGYSIEGAFCSSQLTRPGEDRPPAGPAAAAPVREGLDAGHGPGHGVRSLVPETVLVNAVGDGDRRFLSLAVSRRRLRAGR